VEHSFLPRLLKFDVTVPPIGYIPSGAAKAAIEKKLFRCRVQHGNETALSSSAFKPPAGQCEAV
jgi:hypothetical protein